MSAIFLAIIRSILVIIGLFFITKLLGKKQLSKLSFFEYVVGITVGDIAGSLSMDSELKWEDGVTSIIIWTCVPILISSFSLRSKKFRDFIEGTPTTFIKDGNILEKHLKKEKYTIDELLEELRIKNIFRVEDIEYATLEANGELSVLLKKVKQPLLVEDMIDLPAIEKELYAIIMDGKINKSVLAKCKLSEKWVLTALEKRGIALEEVFLAQIDYSGGLTFDFYDK